MEQQEKRNAFFTNNLRAKQKQLYKPVDTSSKNNKTNTYITWELIVLGIINYTNFVKLKILLA
jgi:hypothetical protein